MSITDYRERERYGRYLAEVASDPWQFDNFPDWVDACGEALEDYIRAHGKDVPDPVAVFGLGES